MIVARGGLASRSSAEMLPVEPIEKYTAPSGPTATLLSACAYAPRRSGLLASGRPPAIVRAVGRRAVGVVVGVDLVALGDVERGARERQPCGWSSPSSSTDWRGAAVVGSQRASPARCSAPTPAARRRVPRPPAGPWASGPTPTSSSPAEPAPGAARRTGPAPAPDRPATVTGTSSAPAAAAVGAWRRRDCDGARCGAGRAGRDQQQRRPGTPIRLCRSQTRMHLPDQDLGGFGGGDALAAGSR